MTGIGTNGEMVLDGRSSPSSSTAIRSLPPRSTEPKHTSAVFDLQSAVLQAPPFRSYNSPPLHKAIAMEIHFPVPLVDPGIWPLTKFIPFPETKSESVVDNLIFGS